MEDGKVEKFDAMTDRELHSIIRVQIRAGNWQGARELSARLSTRTRREPSTAPEGVSRTRLLEVAA